MRDPRISPCRGRRLGAAATATIVLAGAILAGGAGGSDRSRYDVRTFTRVPDPGLPEGIAVDKPSRDRRRIFVGTSPKDAAGLDGKPPSEIFAYSRHGRLRRSFTIQGQDRSNPGYGLYGLALDAAHHVYAVDVAPPRIIKVNPRTGAQHDYAEFPDVHPCALPTGGDQCSDTLGDRPPFPNFAVFARDGTMYVTDNAQALIWRVPPGGERAKVWFTDRGMESDFGPNGMALTRDRHTLMFAETNQGLQNFPAGLYTLPIKRGGEPGALRLFWSTSSFDAPDGFAIARSGRVYVACSAPGGDAGVAVLSPGGREIARVPGSPQENQQQDVPFDSPANVAFLGRRALITNHAFITRDSSHYAVLDLFADEHGLPLVRP
jgi:hypothetical protein